MWNGARAMVSAAISPWASGASRLAAATAGAQAAAAGLLRNRPIPYTPASTAKITAAPPTAASRVTRRRAVPAGSAVGLADGSEDGSVMNGKTSAQPL